MSSSTLSPAQLLAADFAACPDPLGALEEALSALTVTELAALWHDWEFWARPKQIIPWDGVWRSWGFCTGRGFGKTRPIAEHVNQEAEAGRAMRIALLAQGEDETINLMVLGQSGLLETAPPWFKPIYESGRVLWPNGAQAFVYTPERPEDLRGPEHHLAWCSEFIAWPATKRDAALMNLEFGLRLGYARLLWDSTPRRKHPIIRSMLKRGERSPRLHVVVRGTSHENEDNLAEGRIAELEAKHGGTQRGREEIDGEYSDEDAGALWQDAWIENHRRPMPDLLVRRALAVDPATSELEGTDDTGISDAGLGQDGQVYVIADLTAKHGWDDWGELVVDRYFTYKCDCITLERNRGGAACAANIRAAARTRTAKLRAAGIGAQEIRVEVVDRKAVTRHVPNTIYVKEVNSQQSKGARAEPVATEYKGGRVSHVIGADLSELEDEQTTWVPEKKKTESPNRMDALVHNVWELARLEEQGLDPRRGFEGIGKAAKVLQEKTGPRAAAGAIGVLLGKSEWGERGL